MPSKPDRYFNDYAGAGRSGDGAAIERATGAIRAGNFDATARRDLPHDGERISRSRITRSGSRKPGLSDKKVATTARSFSSLSSNHEMFIPTGYGVEGALPDATCYDITHNVIAPFFKKNDYTVVLKPASPR